MGMDCSTWIHSTSFRIGVPQHRCRYFRYTRVFISVTTRVEISVTTIVVIYVTTRVANSVTTRVAVSVTTRVKVRVKCVTDYTQIVTFSPIYHIK